MCFFLIRQFSLNTIVFISLICYKNINGLKYISLIQRLELEYNTSIPIVFTKPFKQSSRNFENAKIHYLLKFSKVIYMEDVRVKYTFQCNFIFVLMKIKLHSADSVQKRIVEVKQI